MMNMHVDKTMENKSRAVANNLPGRKGKDKLISQYVNNRQEGEAQNTLKDMADSSPGVKQLRAVQTMINNAGLHTRGSNVVQCVLSQQEYDQVKALANQIMERYPPERYHYLGLGKSPTPVMAFLQNYGRLADINATNMPLSKFGHRTDSMSGAEERVVDGSKLNAEQRSRLWEHFDNFVPNIGDLEGKDILLIDFVQTGKSLIATQRHLQEYLRERYRGTGVTGAFFGILSSLACFPSAPTVSALPLAIEEQQVGGTKRTMDDLGLSSKALMIPGSLGDENSLAARMGGEKYKPQAEYPADFKISAEERPTTKSIQKDPEGFYAELLNEFAEFMASDGELVELLEGSNAIDNLKEDVHEIDSLLYKLRD